MIGHCRPPFFYVFRLLAQPEFYCAALARVPDTVGEDDISAEAIRCFLPKIQRNHVVFYIPDFSGAF